MAFPTSWLCALYVLVNRGIKLRRQPCATTNNQRSLKNSSSNVLLESVLLTPSLLGRSASASQPDPTPPFSIPLFVFVLPKGIRPGYSERGLHTPLTELDSRPDHHHLSSPNSQLTSILAPRETDWLCSNRTTSPNPFVVSPDVLFYSYPTLDVHPTSVTSVTGFLRPLRFLRTLLLNALPSPSFISRRHNVESRAQREKRYKGLFRSPSESPKWYVPCSSGCPIRSDLSTDR